MKIISTPVAFISLALTWRWSGLKRMEAGTAPTSSRTGHGNPFGGFARPEEVPKRSDVSPTGSPPTAAADAGTASQLAALEASLRERDREIAELKACLAGGNAWHGPNLSKPLLQRGSSAPLASKMPVAAGLSGDEVTSNPRQRDLAEGDTSDRVGTSDPFEDMLDASWRVLVLLQDAASFMLESLMSNIWQWPADSSTASSQIDLTAFTGLVRAVVESPRSADTELPPEVLARLSDVQRVMRSAAEMLRARLGVALKDMADGMQARLSPEMLSQCRDAWLAVQDASDRARAAAKAAAAECSSTAQALQHSAHAWLEAFLERHPQHRASLHGRNPVLLVAAVLPIAASVAWRAAMLLRTILLVLRGPVVVARSALRVLCVPVACCLCRRRRHQQPMRGERTSSPRLLELTDGTDDLSPVPAGKALRKTSVRAAAPGLRAARRGGA